MPRGPRASPDRNCRTNWLSELNSSSAGPDSTILPFQRIAMYSATRRADMMSCVMTTYAPPFSSWISWISSHRSAVRTGSRPESGSSKSTIRGSSTSARAKPARLRMPPDSSLGILSPAPPSPTSLRRRFTMSAISSSPLSVCWRSGNATLSQRFIEPNRAPSWNSTPNFLRISNSSSSAMSGTDSPWTSTSPSSGYSSPTMCLMHTDLPVPDGPRIIEIWLSGRPRFSPFSTRLRPKALTTSMNSTASSDPWSRALPVCHWYSSASACEPRSCVISPVGAARSSCSGRCSCSSAPRFSSHSCGSSGRVSSSSGRPSVPESRSSARSCSLRSSLTSASPAYRGSRVRAPEDLGPHHSDQVDHDRVQHHRFRRRRPNSHRSPARVVAVVTTHEHDHSCHRHALYEAVEQIRWILEHPENQEEAPGRHLADLLHHRQVAREEAGADRRDVHERKDHPGGEQPRRAQEDERVDAHHLERVDLVGDPHGADLGHEARADLRRHHVAERVRHDLAQVAPGTEHARVRRSADGAVEVRALDAALEPEDERKAPDHERRAEDQDAGLAERLAEEVEDAAVEDRADDSRGELRDVSERRDPVARDAQPAAAHYLITEISGWVASSVCVKT